MYSREPPSNYLDTHQLFRAVHRGLWQHWQSLDRIDPVFFHFKKNERGLSFDWSKYTTPTDTLNRRKNNTLKEYGIIQLNIGKFRKCIELYNLPLEIEHDPVPDNRAHSLICGLTKVNKTKIRRKLSKITNWVDGKKPIQ